MIGPIGARNNDHSRTRAMTERCPKRTRKGAECAYPAGSGTDHLGYGSCSRHGGAWPQSEQLWSEAMEISRKENVTPTEALLGLVRTAMGRSAYVENLLTEKVGRHIENGGDPLELPPDIRLWMKESRNERLLAAKTAKAAVDAGVMIAMAQRTDLEGGLVADAVAAALDALQLSTEERMKALGAAQERLLNAD